MLAEAPLEKEDAMPNSSPLVRSFGALRAHTANDIRQNQNLWRSCFRGPTSAKGAQIWGTAAVFCFALLLSGCVGSKGSPAVIATQPAGTTVTVTISSPSNGAALSSSSVHVLATAAGQQPIRTLVILLDGAQVATANGSGIDTMITAGNGAHTLT